MHILITGGTGFIGRALCQFLAEAGHQLMVLTRDDARCTKILSTDIQCIASLDVISGDTAIDAIINLAGESIFQRWTQKTRTSILQSRVQGTQSLVQWIQQATHKPAVFISGSAIGVYGTHPDTAFTEETPPDTTHGGVFSHEVCHQWEEAARNGLPDGIRLCLLRTGVVLEKDGGALSQMLTPFRLGLGGPIGSGKQWFSWIHRYDLLRLILFLIDHEEISGPVNGTAPEPVTNRYLSTTLGQELGRPAILPMPAFMVSLLFGQMGEELLLRGQHVTPAAAHNYGFMFEHATIEKALQDIL